MHFKKTLICAWQRQRHGKILPENVMAGGGGGGLRPGPAAGGGGLRRTLYCKHAARSKGTWIICMQHPHSAARPLCAIRRRPPALFPGPAERSVTFAQAAAGWPDSACAIMLALLNAKSAANSRGVPPPPPPPRFCSAAAAAPLAVSADTLRRRGSSLPAAAAADRLRPVC